VIPLKDQESIREKFSQELLGQVKIDLFTERDTGLTVPGKQPCVTCKPTREMLQEIAGLSDWISLRVHYLEDRPEEAVTFGVERVPAIVLRGRKLEDEDTRFYTFYGIPGGTEFPSFIETITDVSRGEVLLTEASVTALAGIESSVNVKVFVTPTCPYCPAMVRLAHQMTMVNPLIRSEGIEVNEFPDLGQRYSVQAVPLTVVNDKYAVPGMIPEDQFVEVVVKAAEDTPPPAEGPSGPTNEVEAPPAPRVERGKERPSGLYIP
jgi:glutaredoxin-like protein